MESKKKTKDCPHCGRCPVCGRRDPEVQPWYPYPYQPYDPYPWTPYPWHPTWTDDSTGNTGEFKVVMSVDPGYPIK